MARHTVAWSAGMILGLGVLGLVVGAQTPAPTGSGTSLTGTTHLASGAAAEGVTVSARAVDQTITTTVFTDEQGQYFFPALSSGKYHVWAQATGYETARAEATLDAARPTRQAFTLSPIADMTPQLSGSEWLAALPEATFEDRRMKEIFRVQCTECHQPNLVLQNRFDERGWLAIINTMEKAGYTGVNPNSMNAPAPMRYHKAELAKYLARMRGPGESPLKFQPPNPRPTGDAARIVVTEYDVPPADTPNDLHLLRGEDWSQGTPGGMHGGRSGLHDVAIDKNGNAWITAWGANLARTLIKVDATTGKATGFKIDKNDKNNPASQGTHGINVDKDGILWFGSDGNLGRMDPATEAIEIYRPPHAVTVGGATDTDGFGKVWTSATNGALRFDPVTKTFMFFPSDDGLMGGGGTYGVTGDSVGNGWWFLSAQDLVGHGNVKTGKSTMVKMAPPNAPGPEAFMTPADREFYHYKGALTYMGTRFTPGSQVPRRGGGDKTGNAVWVANWWGGNLAKMDVKTLKPTYYQIPGKGMHPYSAVVDKDHNVYANISSDDSLAKFDPKTNRWTIYRMPSRGSETRHINVNLATGDIWLPYASNSRIARVQFRTQAEIQALKNASAPARAQAAR